MSSTEEPPIQIRQPLTTAQNRLIATSYGAVCATLGLSTLAVSPTYILSNQTHPEAASKIEMVLFGTVNTIFRAGLDKNIYTSPIKAQLSYLILEKYKRLANYLIEGLDQVRADQIQLMTVTHKTQNYVLPRIIQTQSATGHGSEFQFAPSTIMRLRSGLQPIRHLTEFECRSPMRRMRCYRESCLWIIISTM